MGDIRLKTRRFSLGGKEYEICVNMNVLADLQEAHDGSIAAVLNPKAELRTSLEIMAAMLNEACRSSSTPPSCPTTRTPRPKTRRTENPNQKTDGPAGGHILRLVS